LEKGRRTLDDGDTPVSTGTLAVSRLERAALLREKWEQLKMNTMGKKTAMRRTARLTADVESTALKKKER
jgi:hypothetical protein